MYYAGSRQAGVTKRERGRHPSWNWAACEIINGTKCWARVWLIETFEDILRSLKIFKSTRRKTMRDFAVSFLIIFHVNIETVVSLAKLTRCLVALSGLV